MQEPNKSTSWLAGVSTVVRIAGSLLTIALTYANHITKTSIEATPEGRLSALRR